MTDPTYLSAEVARPVGNVWICRSCGGEDGVVCDINVAIPPGLPIKDARPVEMVCGPCGASWPTTWQRMMLDGTALEDARGSAGSQGRAGSG